MTEGGMIGWHHRLNGHEFEQTLRDREGQRSLVCCSPLGCKELYMTKQLNNNNNPLGITNCFLISCFRIFLDMKVGLQISYYAPRIFSARIWQNNY